MKERPGEATWVSREGSLQYMSPEMVALKRFGSGYIDLYQNDKWGLERTIVYWKNMADARSSFTCTLQPFDGEMTRMDIALHQLAVALNDPSVKPFPSNIFLPYFREFNPNIQ